MALMKQIEGDEKFVAVKKTYLVMLIFISIICAVTLVFVLGL